MLSAAIVCVAHFLVVDLAALSYPDPLEVATVECIGAKGLYMHRTIEAGGEWGELRMVYYAPRGSGVLEGVQRAKFTARRAMVKTGGRSAVLVTADGERFRAVFDVHGEGFRIPTRRGCYVIPEEYAESVNAFFAEAFRAMNARRAELPDDEPCPSEIVIHAAASKRADTATREK
jgi:hypothetical protein